MFKPVRRCYSPSDVGGSGRPREGGSGSRRPASHGPADTLLRDWAVGARYGSGRLEARHVFTCILYRLNYARLCSARRGAFVSLRSHLTCRSVVVEELFTKPLTTAAWGRASRCSLYARSLLLDIICVGDISGSRFLPSWWQRKTRRLTAGCIVKRASGDVWVDCRTLHYIQRRTHVVLSQRHSLTRWWVLGSAERQKRRGAGLRKRVFM